MHDTGLMFSPPLYISTVPNGPPQSVMAVSMSSTTMNVSWEEIPPGNRNGLILMYEIIHEPLETFGQLLMTDTRNTTNLSIVVDGLHPFVNYNISVRAYTSVGNGPSSVEIVEMTLQDR